MHKSTKHKLSQLQSSPPFSTRWASKKIICFKLFVCTLSVYPVCHYFAILLSIVLLVASIDGHLPLLAACHCRWLLMLKIVIGCYLANKILSLSFSGLTLLVWRQEEQLACNKLEWSGAGIVICLSRVTIRWSAYGLADVTATPSSLASWKSRIVYHSGASLPRLSWKLGH